MAAAARSRFPLHPVLLLLLLLSAEPSSSLTNQSPPAPSPLAPLHSPHPSPSNPPLSSPSYSSPAPAAPLHSPFHSPSALPVPAPSPHSPSSSSTPSPSPAASPSPAPSFASIHSADSNNVQEGSPSEKGGLSGGQKAGIGLGVVVGATVVGVGAMVYKKRQENIRRSRYGYATRRDML